MKSIGFACKPAFISIHIPKTAGSSFHAALRDAYGWRLKHIQKVEDIKRLSKGQSFAVNKPFVKVLHGHIRPHKNWKMQFKNAKWLCWLRDPASRVISAYHHLEKTQQLGDRNQALFQKLQPTLEDFLTHPEFKPVTHIYRHFLGQFSPQDFAFIGRTEHYASDLKLCGKLMGKPLNVFNENVGLRKIEMPEKEYEQVKELLAPEYEIYTTFLNHFYHEA